MNQRNTVIDLAKYIASLMVVAIHTGLLSDVYEPISFVLIHIVCRAAVPFFAVCSGYLLGCRLKFGEKMSNDEHNRNIFFNQWKKLVLLYVCWSIVYLIYSIPKWIEIGWFSPWAFVDYAFAAVTKGSYYHFWYIWGMIYTLPILYVFLRFCKRKYWIFFLVVLWSGKVLGYAYPNAVPQQLLFVLESLGTLLCLLPFLIVGVLISSQKNVSIQFCLCGTALSLICLVIEAFLLRYNGHEAVSYVIFTLPTAHFLFCLILKFRQRNIQPLHVVTSTSGIVYCVHPILIGLMERTAENSIYLFVFAAIGSTMFGMVYHYIENRFQRRKI